jgi:hypothetical protein
MPEPSNAVVAKKRAAAPAAKPKNVLHRRVTSTISSRSPQESRLWQPNLTPRSLTSAPNWATKNPDIEFHLIQARSTDESNRDQALLIFLILRSGNIRSGRDINDKFCYGSSNANQG